MSSVCELLGGNLNVLGVRVERWQLRGWALQWGRPSPGRAHGHTEGPPEHGDSCTHNSQAGSSRKCTN